MSLTLWEVSYFIAVITHKSQNLYMVVIKGLTLAVELKLLDLALISNKRDAVLLFIQLRLIKRLRRITSVFSSIRMWQWIHFKMLELLFQKVFKAFWIHILLNSK